MENLLRDLRHALRVLRQGGSFTVTAVAALAVGIGANTAIFSLVNTVLLKPPPFREADRIVIFEAKTNDRSFGGASPAKFNHWMRQTTVVEDVAAFGSSVLNWTGGETPEQLRSMRASSAYFRLFGVPMVMGRGFDESEDRPGATPVAVISEGLWRRRFAADPALLGKTMVLGGQPHTVTGIVDSRFDFQDFGRAPDVWVPIQIERNSRDQGHYFQSAGRLKPGVSLEQARSRLNASRADYLRDFPNSLPEGQSFTASTLQESLVRDARSSIWILAGAVAFVLLIACANVANLLLARAEVRRRELAIRAALGAGRGAILRQLMMESLLLAAAGAICGLALGYAGMRALLSVNTAGLPRVGTDGVLVTLDWRVLIFTVAITVLTSVFFGMLPALRASRTDLSSTLKESSSRSGSGFRQNKARTVLVVSEVALAVVLLVGAGLLIRTAAALYTVKPGFDTANVLTMRMSLTGNSYKTSAAIERLVRAGVERLQLLPGVELATASCCVPLEGGYGLGFRVMGRPLEKGLFHGGGGWRTVSPGFFEAFRIPVVRGRSINERDVMTGPPVVVISETMAKRFWPNGDPLRDMILIGKGSMPHLETEQPRQIVGIVGDLRDGALNRDPGPSMYIPNAQTPDAVQALNVMLTPLAWIIRTKGDPMQVRAQAEEELRKVSGLPVSDVRAMGEVVSRSTSRQRFHMLLMTVFGAVALLLAAIGIYGLMAYSVEQRRQEIGIRMALGAQHGDVRGMVFRQGMIFALAGVALGVAGAFALAKQISSFLFGVTPFDPAVFGVIPVVLVLTAALAVWVPARRATRVDPLTALRES